MFEILPLEIHSLTSKVLNVKISLLKRRCSWKGGELESFLNYHLCEDSMIAGLRAAALKELGQKVGAIPLKRK